MMKENRIGILTVQETHLDEDSVRTLKEMYGRRLEIFSSGDPVNPTAARGIAVVLNKEVTSTREAEMETVIPGRAIMVSLNWHRDKILRVLAVYAPNGNEDNEKFWKEIREWWDRKRAPRPDLMMGDFNMVEDAIDRRPARLDGGGAVEELIALRANWGLMDGWRTTYPDNKEFSYAQTWRNGERASESRIDRIYASTEIVETALDWRISIPQVDSDHLMVSVKLVDRKAPFIGPGRWTMPGIVLENERFIDRIRAMGKEATAEIEGIEERTATKNPQVIYAEYKKKIVELARETAKRAVPKVKKQIRELQTELERAKNGGCVTQATKIAIQERIRSLEIKRDKDVRLSTRARYCLEGECVSRYWSAINREKKPREIIYSLTREGANGTEEVCKSCEMAELARDHHNRIQGEGLANEEVRRRTTDEILAEITAEADPEAAGNLEKRIQREEIEEAISKAECGKATGLDGIPYELWKTLAKEYARERKVEAITPGFDAVTLLKTVFNDIERFGVAEGTDFTKGWICPLYKKKERNKIENYRPITLLNSDYKIMTKVLAMRLATVAPEIVHPDQAGFMPNRQITDQVRLTQLMTSFAEAVEEDGIIVALDQEKAYDKIEHEYLWRTLKKYGLPQEFIQTVKALYADAVSVVVINGEMSSSFRISRGVRQGDPLSCLLFDIAIEPLATLLRKSPLKGYHIPGTAEKTITSLFADDTTVFLAKEDDFGVLQATLERWCKASGAKFNKEKTEIIPLGSTAYRESVYTTRKMSQAGPDLPEGVRIAKDGESTRILGAWIGNKTDDAQQWTTTVDKIVAALDRWKKCKPTQKGKRLIIQMFVGGMSQYLTAAQGMPDHTIRALNKIITTFLWNGGKPRVNLNTLQAGKETGGMAILDVEARNEAIDLMWLKGFLKLSEHRPKWAYVADVLLAQNTLAKHKTMPESAKINIFLQEWDVKTDRRGGLPECLKRMMRVAKKHNARFEAIKLSAELKKKLPMWYHIGGSKRLALYNNTPAGKCLRNNHGVKTVGDALIVANRTRHRDPDDPHEKTANCQCGACTQDRNTHQCRNPNRCALAAQRLIECLQPKWDPDSRTPDDGLSLTPRRIQKNEKAQKEGGPVLFNPSITVKDDIGKIFRVFTEPDAPRIWPGRRAQRNGDEWHDEITAYTDGSSTNNGCENAKVGSGVWIEDNHEWNAAVRLPNEYKTNQAGEAAAVLIATQNIPNVYPLLIKSDSESTINALTENLEEMEDRGWIGIANRELLKATVAKMRKRAAPVALEWVKGHAGIIGNEKADGQAGRGANDPTPTALDLNIDPDFNLTGARIASLTQALAYAGIREKKVPQPRPKTTAMITKIQAAMQSEGYNTPTEPAIWRAIRHKDITRKISDFMWLTLHDAHRVGSFWLKIPNHEDRAVCPLCEELEDMEHILLKCKAKCVRTIWEEAEILWTKTGKKWPTLNMGTVTTPALIDFKETGRKTSDAGANRLYRIIISETAHLLWRLRCERRIAREDKEEKQHSEEEARNMWRALIKQRIELDKGMTNKSLSKKALKESVVYDTWSRILRDDTNLPDGWATAKGVLVGLDHG